MNERTKNILLGVLIVGIISMTVAYASLTQNLRINSSAKVQGNSTSWNIHFKHITNTANEVQPKEYATSASNSITLSETNTVATMPAVTLKAPGDSVEFYFNVINEGEITGYLNTINNITIPDPTYANDETLTTEQRTQLKNWVSATLTKADGSALVVDEALAQNQELELKLVIRFSSEANILPSKNVTFSGITTSLVYGQSATPAPSNPYETDSSGTYQYKTTDEFGSTLDNSWKAYLRTDGTTPEVCGVFGSGQSSTVCMTSSYYNSDYSSAGSYGADFADVNSADNITTTSGLQATGLKGYSLAKAEEMLSKGASSCYVYNGSVGCYMPSSGRCDISNIGNVHCSDRISGVVRHVRIYYDGSVY